MSPSYAQCDAFHMLILKRVRVRFTTPTHTLISLHRATSEYRSSSGGGRETTQMAYRLHRHRRSRSVVLESPDREGERNKAHIQLVVPESYHS